MGFSIGSNKRKTDSCRFWEKVANGPNGCWNWTGGRQPNGYAQFNFGGTGVLVHRYAYKELIGPLVDGLTIDHLCRNRICVNPAHLEQVTYRENIFRGSNAAVMNSKKAVCQSGHELHGGNLYIHTDRGGGSHRYCRQCNKERMRKWRRKKRSIDITPQDDE